MVSSSSRVLAFGIALMLLYSVAHGAAAIPCNQAIQDLLPCMPYLSGSGPIQPSAACCTGVQTVATSATTTQQLKDLCVCIKTAASQVSVNPDRAKELPASCNVKVPVPIDPNVNCNSIA